MEYKMSELVTLTDAPKSTILYYIKEGLLPQANKLKSNVHRYNEEHVELIKYIQYVKQELGSTNEQIKTALENKNQSFSSSFTMLAPLMQTLSAIPSGTQNYSQDDFCEKYDFDFKLIDKLLKDGILLPIGKSGYTTKEASIVRLVEKFTEIGLEYEVIKEYVHHAKALADIEHSVQKKLCSMSSDKNFSDLWKIMFETLFNAKEYIFSRYTHRVLLRALKEEIEIEKHECKL